jgi:hypothetical protein
MLEAFGLPLNIKSIECRKALSTDCDSSSEFAEATNQPQVHQAK